MHTITLHVSIAAPGGPAIWSGILIAVLGAICLAFGAHLQQAGVAVSSESDAHGALTGRIKRVLLLVRRPQWMLGTALIAVAIPLQLGALALSPLVVVQPIGVVALLVSTVVEKRPTERRIRLRRRAGVLACIGGVAAFVVIAARNADRLAVGRTSLSTSLIAAVAVLAVMATAAFVTRGSTPAVVSVALAGICYGTVATLAKVIIHLLTTDGLSPQLAWCGVLLITALALGIHFVHRGYASGPASLVVAGLTVIDPLVAVGAGALLLHEMRPLSVGDSVVMLLAGCVAIAGVYALAWSAERRAASPTAARDTPAIQQDYPDGPAELQEYRSTAVGGQVRRAPSR